VPFDFFRYLAPMPPMRPLRAGPHPRHSYDPVCRSRHGTALSASSAAGSDDAVISGTDQVSSLNCAPRLRRLMHDPYELGAAGVPYLNQSDYLPILLRDGHAVRPQRLKKSLLLRGTAFTARCITAEIFQLQIRNRCATSPPKLNSRRRLHFARRAYGDEA